MVGNLVNSKAQFSAHETEFIPLSLSLSPSPVPISVISMSATPGPKQVPDSR